MAPATDNLAAALTQIEVVWARQHTARSDEAVDAVRAAQHELRTSAPRVDVLKPLLTSIAVAIQTLGAAEPAIKAFYDGAKAIGIPLP